MPSIQITSTSTIKNSTWTREVLFNPFANDLVCALDFNLSLDIAATPNVLLRITFEIIEFRTNSVVFYNVLNWNVPLSWQNLWALIGPMTPHDIGLVWGQGDIFGYRASVEAEFSAGTSGLQAFNALAVSDILWFRLERLFLL